MYTSVAGVSQSLEVFPFASKAFDTPLPFAIGPFAYSPDGRALYAKVLRFGTCGLFRIEFSPTRATPIPGSETVGVGSLAVTQRGDKLVIAGGQRGAPCSIFEFVLASGAVRKLISASPCDPMKITTHWGHLSVAPDGNRATALRNHRLELIDFSKGTAAAIPGEFVLGTWSPDGKWLAAVKSGSDTTFLLDSTTLRQRRVVGPTLLVWSPDSRYLLADKRRTLCGLYAATLEVVDVETGARTEIASSRCRVDRNTVGWVSRGIAQ